MTEEKKKKGLFERYLEWGFKPLRVLTRETLKGVKEGLKEEEKVIVKIRCQSCNNLYDESLDKCPHCGSKR